MGKRQYQAGKPLTPEAVIDLVAEEALLDGTLDEREVRLLTRLITSMGLAEASGKHIVKEASRRHRDRDLGPSRPFHPEILYQRILFFAVSDGQLEPFEENILAALRKSLKIPYERHRTLLEDACHPGFAAATNAAASPPPALFTRPERGLRPVATSPPIPSTESADKAGPPAEPEFWEELVDWKGAPKPLDPPAPSSLVSVPTPPPVSASLPPAPVMPPTLALTLEASSTPHHPPEVQKAATQGSPALDPMRRPGEKAGSVTFPLRPGGLPIPDRVNAACAGIAALVICLATFFVANVLGLGARGRGFEGVAKAAIAGVLVIYWGLRKAYESTMFEPGARIEVDARRMLLPGFLVGRRKPMEVQRDMIQKLVFTPGSDKVPPHLAIKLTDGKSLTFWEPALEADLASVGKAIQQYMLKPCETSDGEDDVSPARVVFLFIAVILGIGCVAVAVAYFG